MPHSTHILSALDFASQSPYKGYKNGAYSQNIKKRLELYYVITACAR
jgi:hypothetical protein